LTGIGEAIKGAAAAAAPSTTGILAAAGDEVSGGLRVDNYLWTSGGEDGRRHR
jgi:hypothetical protein